jgi:hypothetical protein
MLLVLFSIAGLDFSARLRGFEQRAAPFPVIVSPVAM